MNFILCIIFYAFYSMHFILCILFHAFYSMHFILCILLYVFHYVTMFLCHNVINFNFFTSYCFLSILTNIETRCTLTDGRTDRLPDGWTDGRTIIDSLTLVYIILQKWTTTTSSLKLVDTLLT
jgi:hypothetical protein